MTNSRPSRQDSGGRSVDSTANKTCEYNNCENDAQTTVLFEDIDRSHEFCAGHAGISVQRHEDAVALNGKTENSPSRQGSGGGE